MHIAQSYVQVLCQEDRSKAQQTYINNHIYVSDYKLICLIDYTFNDYYIAHGINHYDSNYKT